MQFVDQVRVFVAAGNGGDGAVAWRREKYVPRGGPAGGDGGRGGDVVLEADPHLTTLLDLRYRHRLKAPSGRPGEGRDKNGRGGEDLVVRVPVGTVVWVEAVGEEATRTPKSASAREPTLEARDDDAMENIVVGQAAALDEAPREPDRDIGAQLQAAKLVPTPPPVAAKRGDLLGDLSEAGERLIVARGGKGGRGNIHFRSSTMRAPDFAEPGTPGEMLSLRLELKLLADVGIVGFPNVGKSTLIGRVSRARPKVGAYPFTTLVPQLGVVKLGEGRSFVVADVPGLIRGASDGKGLGDRFLRHLERTRVLVHLLAPDPDPEREPLADLDALEHELSRYGAGFPGRPRVVALNKLDLLRDEDGEALVAQTRDALRERNIPLFVISAHTGEGVDRLLQAIERRLAVG